MKQIYLIIVTLLLVIGVAAGGGYWWWSSRSQEPSPETEQPEQIVPETTELEESEPEIIALKDVESEATTPAEIKSEETESEETDLDLIKAAMAKKHDKDIEDVDLTVNEKTVTHAQGGLKFAGEVGGGWWLAAKIDEGWVIAADGNGSVMCDDIEPYDFPVDMVPECWDQATSTLITRE